VKNIADSFRQHYNGGSSAVNIDHGRKKRSPTPGFQQTYMAGSHYENIDSTGASTGMQTWTGGQSVAAENNGNQHSTINQNVNNPTNHNQANPSNHNQANGNYLSNPNQGNDNYPSNQATGNSGSGFEQTYMPGSHYENIDSTGATTGVHTVGGVSDNSAMNYPSNHNQENANSGHHQANENYTSNHNQANGNYPSNHNNQASGNSGSGFKQTYMPGSHYENIDSTGSSGIQTVMAEGIHDNRNNNFHI